MTQSTITEKFQTTIPVDIRKALKLTPHQKVTYEVLPNGSVLLRPLPTLDELFGSIKIKRPIGTIREEKQAAAKAMAQAAVRKELRLKAPRA